MYLLCRLSWIREIEVRFDLVNDQNNHQETPKGDQCESSERLSRYLPRITSYNLPGDDPEIFGEMIQNHPKVDLILNSSSITLTWSDESSSRSFRISEDDSTDNLPGDDPEIFREWSKIFRELIQESSDIWECLLGQMIPAVIVNSPDWLLRLSWHLPLWKSVPAKGD